MAPTFLDLAGIPVPEEMTGKSLRPLLLSGRSGRIDPQRNTAFSGFERHIIDARAGNVGYPSRAIHTDDYLYIRNPAPDRWPVGEPETLSDIDTGSPYKSFLLRTKPENRGHFWHLAAGKRPAEELYAVSDQSDSTHNLADDPRYQKIRDSLWQHLLQEKHSKQRQPFAFVFGHSDSIMASLGIGP